MPSPERSGANHVPENAGPTQSGVSTLAAGIAMPMCGNVQAMPAVPAARVAAAIAAVSRRAIASGYISRVIPWLRGDAPFPPVENALTSPNGLLCAGGDLSPERLVAA